MSVNSVPIKIGDVVCIVKREEWYGVVTDVLELDKGTDIAITYKHPTIGGTVVVCSAYSVTKVVDSEELIMLKVKGIV